LRSEKSKREAKVRDLGAWEAVGERISVGYRAYIVFKAELVHTVPLAHVGGALQWWSGVGRLSLAMGTVWLAAPTRKAGVRSYRKLAVVLAAFLVCPLGKARPAKVFAAGRL
jgi:hypothetical protein